MTAAFTLSNLESSQCLDPECGCPSHRAPDLGLLDLYGLDTMQMALTPVQARLLACLLPPNVTVMTRVLLRRIWGDFYISYLARRLVCTSLNRLRSKLPDGWRIVSIADSGYRLECATERVHA